MSKFLEAIARKEGYLKSKPMNRAVRNNNPGNLEWGPFARQHGATRIEEIPPGYTSTPRFAYFPDVTLGWKAMRERFATGMYKGLTVKQAMYKYAPPNENDTDSYIKFICQRVGCTPDTLVEELL